MLPVSAQGAPDLSQLVVGTDALGDAWTISGEGPEESANSHVYGTLLPNAQPHPIADYVVEFKQDTHTVDVGLYEYSDRSTALASPGFSDPPLFWGHGSTSFQPLAGYGDGPSYRASGNNNGITFVDGNIVSFIMVDATLRGCKRITSGFC